jgi:hypothetical protein
MKFIYLSDEDEKRKTWGSNMSQEI